MLLTQELQPGQPFLLIRTQLEPQSGRRLDPRNALRRRQFVGKRQYITLPAKLPTTDIAQLGETRRIEARQAQGIAARKPIKKIDQRRRQGLEPPGRCPDALVRRRLQLNRFLIVDLL